MLFRNICPVMDTPDVDCNSVDWPARSSPPGCYGQEPILWTNLLDTNAIVNSKAISFGNEVNFMDKNYEWKRLHVLIVELWLIMSLIYLSLTYLI